MTMKFLVPLLTASKFEFCGLTILKLFNLSEL